jgi:hypothetical protein
MFCFLCPHPALAISIKQTNVAALVGENFAQEFNPSAHGEKNFCGTSSIFFNVHVMVQGARMPVNTTRHALKQIHPATFFQIAS